MAYREATAQFETARQAAESERTNLVSENEHLVAEIGKIEALLATEQAQSKSAEGQVAIAKQTHAESVTQLQETREKLAAATARGDASAGQLKEALARSERLEGELAAIAKAQAQKPKP